MEADFYRLGAEVRARTCLFYRTCLLFCTMKHTHTLSLSVPHERTRSVSLSHTYAGCYARERWSAAAGNGEAHERQRAPVVPGERAHAPHIHAAVSAAVSRRRYIRSLLCCLHLCRLFVRSRFFVCLFVRSFVQSSPATPSTHLTHGSKAACCSSLRKCAMRCCSSLPPTPLPVMRPGQLRRRLRAYVAGGVCVLVLFRSCAHFFCCEHAYVSRRCRKRSSSTR